MSDACTAEAHECSWHVGGALWNDAVLAPPSASQVSTGSPLSAYPSAHSAVHCWLVAVPAPQSVLPLTTVRAVQVAATHAVV